MVNIQARNVLLLNASWQPMRAITIRKAVDLLIKDTAEGVEGVAACLRTPSTVFVVPSVIRLKMYRKVPQRKAVWTKRNVLRRDRYTCVYCGLTIGNERNGEALVYEDFTLEHIIPQSLGGKNTWSNTACACFKCNLRKGDRTHHEAGMPLLWEPKRPRVNYLIASGNIPEEWKAYIPL